MPETPTRVLLRGDHPWSGHTGEVLGDTSVMNTNALKVRLDNGQEVLAFDDQWSRVTRVR